MHSTRLRPNACEGSRARQVFVRWFFSPGTRDLRVNHGSATSAKLLRWGGASWPRSSLGGAAGGLARAALERALAGRRPQLAVGDVRRQPRRHRAARLRHHAPESPALRPPPDRHRPVRRADDVLDPAARGPRARGQRPRRARRDLRTDQPRGRPAGRVRADQATRTMAWPHGGARPTVVRMGGRRRDGRSVDRRGRVSGAGAMARFALQRRCSGGRAAPSRSGRWPSTCSGRWCSACCTARAWPATRCCSRARRCSARSRRSRPGCSRPRGCARTASPPRRRQRARQPRARPRRGRLGWAAGAAVI